MISDGLVCAIGIGTVFFGLICLVFICMIMSAVCKVFVKEAPVQSAPKAVSAQNTVSSNVPVQNKQEIIAGACAAIAEELGTDVKNIKVTSFKKVD